VILCQYRDFYTPLQHPHYYQHYYTFYIDYINMDRIAELELHDIIPLIALAALEEAQTAREVQMAKAPRSTSLSGDIFGPAHEIKHL
jgi:hypothetical protein